MTELKTIKELEYLCPCDIYQNEIADIKGLRLEAQKRATKWEKETNAGAHTDEKDCLCWDYDNDLCCCYWFYQGKLQEDNEFFNLTEEVKK